LSSRNIKIIKREIRVLGIDDGKFAPHSKNRVLVVGVVFRGGCWLEGVMSTSVAVDGLDATGQIAEMVKASPHFKQLRVVMLNGVTLAGFNVVDIKALNKQTGLPVVVVTDKKPNLAEVHAALKHLPDSEERWNAILNAGEIFSVVTRGKSQRIYAETAGIARELAVEVLRLSATHSKIPEVLRAAHLIASGVTTLR
jgi:endonuclease V-like protein UPF0215 family